MQIDTKLSRGIRGSRVRELYEVQHCRVTEGSIESREDRRRFQTRNGNFDARALGFVCVIESGLSRSNVLFACRQADMCRSSFMPPIVALRANERTE